MDFEKIRADFPILEREVKPGVPLIYLDSTASSQKPRQVIDAMTAYYELQNANVHRGVHALSEEATEAYEGARQRIADFINAASAQEIIYTRNTTESINLVAFSWGRSNLTKGDVIVLTEMEHHSNIVPWQMLAAELDLRLEFIPVTEDGLLEMEEYHKLLELKPKIVAFAHMSNVLGTINPAKEIIELAHSAGAITVVDAAQSVPHFAVDIQDLDADFYAFSGHKMLGPTGIGILYGKKDLLKAMPPFLGGGDMIKRVELRSFIANELPHKFEAGTPAIAEAIGLGAAVDYLNEVGMDAIFAHEAQLTEYALERLEEVPGVWLFGPSADKKGGVASFTFEGVHPHDVSEILDRSGVAVRAGHHCAMPLHNKFNINATARASFYLYNTESDVDRLIEGLYKVKEVYG
ncbi:MAG: cysteine desulfurase [Chloroflexi bacterium]|nr:cysteine desulfurase [Chloroflexota bacterium]